MDVNLREQVLVAYEGKKPVLATLVSTGKGRSTPTGTFYIQRKRAVSFMKSRPKARGDVYNLDTPWVITLQGRIAMHAAYWHNEFGRARSHGCVNLAPRDAKFLYDWSTPTVPDGWKTLMSADDSEGTLIRVR